MNTQIYEEASTWLIEFRTEDADIGTRRRFGAWLTRSPEHVRAYLELTALSEDAGQIDADRKVDVEALIAAARAESNVIGLPATTTAGRGGAARHRRSPFGLATAALVLTFAVGMGVWLGVYRFPSYATQLGEQRTIRLEDGSAVELNARSRIRVRYTEQERAVDLLDGQALFRVAKIANRPFVVGSGAARVRAVGTEFDVNRTTSGTVITVLEGRVAVLPSSARASQAHGSGAQGLALSAGEQVTLTEVAIPRPKRANVAAATAWTQEQLVFESAKLADVAQAFNRYNARQLLIEGAGLEDFHISGTFSTSDPGTLPRFLIFLHEQPGIRLTESDDEIVVSQK